MRLSEYTDYTLRVLMYCARNRQRLVTIAELAERHDLSKGHLMKVVNDLARQGLIETTRGRGGGLRLSREPASIRIGDVVRASETDFRLVECFDAGTSACTLTPGCRLRQVFDAALSGYFRALDGATLADLTADTTDLVAAPTGATARRGPVVSVALPVSTRPARPAKAPAQG
ncbi:MAG: Rrf2 family transcriptional regulator [Burkholderiaceae bacterium]|nr:Rrf2 family transcriptional regulator [Burkholderiaceae bacterium]